MYCTGLQSEGGDGAGWEGGGIPTPSLCYPYWSVSVAENNKSEMNPLYSPLSGKTFEKFQDTVYYKNKKVYSFSINTGK